jgi:multidrug efflux pump
VFYVGVRRLLGDRLDEIAEKRVRPDSADPQTNA